MISTWNSGDFGAYIACFYALNYSKDRGGHPEVRKPFSNRGVPSWGPQRCKGKPGELDACIEGAAVSVSQTNSSTSGDSLAAPSSEWWSCDHLSTSVIIMFTSRRLKKNLMIVDDCIIIIIFHSLPKPLDTHQAHCWCFPWLLGFVTRIRRHPSGPPSERERCERSHPHQWSAPWWVASASDQQDHGTWVWGLVVPHCQDGRRFMELLRGKMGRQKCIRNAFFPGWERKCERSLIKNLDKPLSFSTQLPPPEPKRLKLRCLVAAGGPENHLFLCIFPVTAPKFHMGPLNMGISFQIQVRIIIFQTTFFRFQPKVRQCMAVYIPRETSQNPPKPAYFCLFLGECRRNGWRAPE